MDEAFGGFIFGVIVSFAIGLGLCVLTASCVKRDVYKSAAEAGVGGYVITDEATGEKEWHWKLPNKQK